MKTIGPYEPRRFLGAGSFGGVWECQNKTTGESVACKLIDLNTALSDKVYPHFRNEILIHSKINHPSVTQLKDVILDNDNVYIFLELCDGGDMNDIVQEFGGLSEDEAEHYFHQIMEALSYIHKLGVAHRDVKLENILVTADDDAKLTDFGLCKQQHGNDPMLTTCGTLVYAAPEIIQEKPYNGMKADIWSAGVVLYAMVAAHFPWIVPDDMPPENIMKETARQIVEGDIALPDGISYELQNLMANLLNVDPNERPTAAEVLEHPWFQNVVEDEAVDPKPNTAIVNLVESFLSDLDRRRKLSS
ncbi:CAMK family protein kinase [Trichomonas vaginalis G3]|uniref:CAMK family protein kinase n=1 Tax=Trichomonas vaginalis (strain ATCC PRA-98 / G3) TaxID=412133 RepID=A2E9I7_TRIV3|nr:protein serine/threonine kinase protein [Trichomonas vaginalis G3]EAY10638.1 CAMK family protein kinase [Trichomonas vaginalis G3]KAI5512223.1 protein serine/threonine kinase protein [Trichomonas vaginalis G3]|eukprot:XP_001322861.1 CAMK family protein kinase [Trichomonas vaginalis G3]